MCLHMCTSTGVCVLVCVLFCRVCVLFFLCEKKKGFLYNNKRPLSCHKSVKYPLESFVYRLIVCDRKRNKRSLFSIV
jgi:hypothetical protein